MDDDLPPGFQRISGKRKPPAGWRGYIMLRCGFCDTRVIYERDQLQWIHDGGPGDIIAVRHADHKSKDGSARPANGSYQ